MKEAEGKIITVGTGKLVKDLGHLSVSFSHPKSNVINIELHHGSRKNVATLRTVRSLINNLIIGVTKGYKYKMRYVYAHFPINVNIDKNNETGLYEVEIRCVSEVQDIDWRDGSLCRKIPADERCETEISLARRSFGKSRCTRVLTSRLQRHKRMRSG